MSTKPVEVSEANTLVPAADEAKEVSKGTHDRRKHKGKGAKAHQAERFRAKKNEQTYSDRMSANRALRDSFCSSVDGMDATLKTMTIGTQYQKPPSEVAVNFAIIGQLAQATVDNMSDCKVQPQEGQVDRTQDVRLIETVTKLQVYAKCAIARAQGPFERDTASHELVSLVREQLSVGFKSSAVLLENVGAFEVNNQQVFPKLPENPAAEQIPPGWTKTTHRFNEGTLYVDLRNMENPPNIASVEVLALPNERKRFSQGELVDLNEVVVQYTRLMGRFAKKMPAGIVPIDLASGKGTCAQIVGSSNAPGRVAYVDERRAWCYREIPQSLMNVGAGFGFGLNSGDPWHVDSMAIEMEGTMRAGAFLAKIVQLNGKVPGAEAR